jgi:enoyl-CoA hydratase
VADLGTLQRLPKFTLPASVSEMAYTGRAVKADEAVRIGLCNGSFPSRELLMVHAGQVAVQIASKSPKSIRGTKKVIHHAMNHSVTEGLEFIARHNADHLLSDDLKESFRALSEKRNPNYTD